MNVKREGGRLRLVMSENKFASVKTAVEHLKKGGFIILSDNQDRENEGDLVALASTATPEIIHQMLKEANGLMCVPVSAKIANNLGLTDMVANSTDPHQTPFTITVDGGYKATGVTTGVSAFDRAASIKHIANPNAKASDFNRPGHIQPLIAQDKGIRTRIGHTEAAVDLAYLAKSEPAAIIIEVLGNDGHMATRDDLFQLAEKLKVPYITISQMTAYLDEHNLSDASQQLNN